MSMRSPSIVFGTALFAVLPCLVFTGCREKESEQASVPTASVAAVTRGDLSSTLTVAGEFQPYQEVDLYAKVSGYIREINVDIGDKVRTGEVLAILEVPELAAQLAASKAQIQHSQSDIDRAKSEVTYAQADYVAVHAQYTRLSQASKQRPGLIAEQELDDARAKDQDSEAKIGVAKSTLEAMQGQLAVSKADNQRVQSLEDYTVVTAPFNGVVTMRYANVGSLIQSGTRSETQTEPVVKVAQSDLLRLRMPVPEEDVPFIHIGGDMKVRVKATGRIIDGKVIRFTRELNISTRTMLAEVDVPNADLSLTTGMYAETTIILQHKTGVLIIPSSAVVKDSEGSYVLVVDSQNKIVKAPVTVGIQGSSRVEIVKGVAEGQTVIVSGQTNYEVGQTVHPKPYTISMPEQGDDE